MKNRLFILIAIAALFLNCNENKSVEDVTTDLEQRVAEEPHFNESPLLIGEFTRDTLESNPYNQWFIQSYKDHTLDQESLVTVKQNIKDVRILLFMGTWCEDSQREVPAFFKILDEIDYESDTVKVITVSEDKTEPAELVKNREITNVPTFIFMKDGKELGRIVEYPLESLEKDMAKILSGQDYKHAYAE